MMSFELYLLRWVLYSSSDLIDVNYMNESVTKHALAVLSSYLYEYGRNGRFSLTDLILAKQRYYEVPMVHKIEF